MDKDIKQYNMSKQDTKDNCYNVDNLSVTVNGERYKII